MGVVSFRLSDEDEKRLRKRGIVPGALAKDLVEAELRKRDRKESLEWLDAHRVTTRGPSVAKLLHQIRDEH